MPSNQYITNEGFSFFTGAIGDIVRFFVQLSFVPFRLCPLLSDGKPAEYQLIKRVK
jgi:hypothetical protein